MPRGVCLIPTPRSVVSRPQLDCYTLPLGEKLTSLSTVDIIILEQICLRNFEVHPWTKVSKQTV